MDGWLVVWFVGSLLCWLRARIKIVDEGHRIDSINLLSSSLKLQLKTCSGRKKSCKVVSNFQHFNFLSSNRSSK